VTLADIGLTARGTLVGNIGYGIAGYCAILPLLLALRALAQLLFRHLPNTAPNPIMPLIVAERDLAWRLVIFVLVALAAPFFEELFFRGALFAGLRSRWGWVASSIVSALLFAVVHPPQDWLPHRRPRPGVRRDARDAAKPGPVDHRAPAAELDHVFLAVDAVPKRLKRRRRASEAGTDRAWATL
jgi:hypothetical protein